MIITQTINKNALIIATISLLLGTIILLTHLITGWDRLITLGLLYVLIAVVLNSITLIGLIANAIIHPYLHKENLTTILLFLLNIPIAIGYLFIVLNNPFNHILI